MKSLSKDQREKISNMLQNLPQEDRKSIVEQIKSLDVNSMNQNELYNSILSILNPQDQTNIITETSINTYA